MKRYILPLVIILLSSSSAVSASTGIIKKSNYIYKSGEVIVKVKQGISQSLLKSSAGGGALPELAKVSVSKTANTIENNAAFENIYTIEYSSPQDPEALAKELAKNPDVIWAEPRYLYKASLTPNDSSYSKQASLAVIKASEGWDIETGNSGVIIAIVDTGVDWQHEDLSSKIWSNADEIAGNGFDDDGNGFDDDVRGWDFGGLSGESDNNPREDQPDHGTHVAGIAAAATNNAKGIAGVGYNCSIMPVKTSRNDVRDNGTALISYGYEGIYYAAQNGAKVINCSWGGYSYSAFGQEVINYAINHGALVVAAAGNDNSGDTHYPSGYSEVLSVAATYNNDARAGFSNYGPTIDVTAPGASILSTWQSNTYLTTGGTSMSSPHAAGLAGLLFAHFPSYTARQIREVLRVNSDNIDALNPNYKYKLGHGRINVVNALNKVNSESVRLSNYILSDAEYGNGDGNFERGEVITLETRFVNYLDASSSLGITLESMNSNAEVQNAAFSAGAIPAATEFGNPFNKFTFAVSSSAPYDAPIVLLLKYSDGSYSDYEIITDKANNSFATQAGGNVSLSIASDGAFSFADYPTNINGSGFKYKGGANLLFEGALMLGTSASQLSDAARDGDAQNEDFQPLDIFELAPSDSLNGYIGSASFTDNNSARTGKLGVRADLTSYTFNDEEYSKFIILQYVIRNLNAEPINGMYAGIFLDWDVSDNGGTDRASYNSMNHFGFVHDNSDAGSVVAGAALISTNKYNFYSILNGSTTGIEIYTDFTKEEKWAALSSGLTTLDAGPGDVSFVVAGGPYDIAANGYVTVAFAVAAGDNITDLAASIASARSIFTRLIDTMDNGGYIPYTFKLLNNYPNPFNPQTTIPFEIPKAGNVTIKVYDVLGREVATLLNEYRQPKNNDYVVFNGAGHASGIYFYSIQYQGNYVTKKMIMMK
jgi:subtilisin family serine protease